jgi:hypothetical protein
MTAQNAPDIGRVPSEVETTAKLLRHEQSVVENQLPAVPAANWPEAVVKARYALNLYSARMAPSDTHYRDLVAAVLCGY